MAACSYDSRRRKFYRVNVRSLRTSKESRHHEVQAGWLAGSLWRLRNFQQISRRHIQEMAADKSWPNTGELTRGGFQLPVYALKDIVRLPTRKCHNYRAGFPPHK